MPGRDSKRVRVPIALACEVCHTRNYRTTKKRADVVALKKFCKVCNVHTLHRESK